MGGKWRERYHWFLLLNVGDVIQKGAITKSQKAGIYNSAKRKGMKVSIVEIGEGVNLITRIQ